MAGAKILCITQIEGVFHYAEVDKKASGYFTRPPRAAATLEELTALCRKASEIHIASVFPSASYQRIQFPKVSRKFLPNLVLQDAREKMGAAESIVARHKVLGEISVAGTPKWLTAYCGVHEKDILALWNTFQAFRSKIRLITPLASAMAAMVAQMEKPEESFAVIWVGETGSMMVIASKDGVVHVARNVPLKLSTRPLNLATPLADAETASAPADIEVDMERHFLDSTGADGDQSAVADQTESPESAPAEADDVVEVAPEIDHGPETVHEAGAAAPTETSLEADAPEPSESGPAADPEARAARADKQPEHVERPLSSGMRRAPDRPSSGHAVKPSDGNEALRFAKELERELGMTSTFFKQEFREAAPGKVYLLGNANLKAIQELHPLPSLYKDVRFHLSMDKVRGLPSDVASLHIHVLGGLFADEAFNFVPQDEIVRRKSTMLLNLGLILLLGGIGLSVAWADHLHMVRSDALERNRMEVARLAQSQGRLAELQAEVERLRPIEGWKQFFDSTVAGKPPWNLFISELAMLLEDHVLITSLQVPSGDGATRNVRLQGKIKASNWEEGLEYFREFGKNLHSSPMFDVTDARYTPEGVTTEPSMFDFHMDLRLKRTDGVG